jgi:hypothetical protein
MIKYKDGYKHQLYEEVLFYIPFLEKYHVETKYFIIDDGTMIIKQGYAWDGASGPTWDTKTVKQASLVHDVLCQCIAYNLLPKTIWRDSNDLLYKMMLEDGAWRWRAKLWLNALNWFGKPEQKKVEIAP